MSRSITDTAKKDEAVVLPSDSRIHDAYFRADNTQTRLKPLPCTVSKNVSNGVGTVLVLVGAM